MLPPLRPCRPRRAPPLAVVASPPLLALLPQLSPHCGAHDIRVHFRSSAVSPLAPGRLRPLPALIITGEAPTSPDLPPARIDSILGPSLVCPNSETLAMALSLTRSGCCASSALGLIIWLWGRGARDAYYCCCLCCLQHPRRQDEATDATLVPYDFWLLRWCIGEGHVVLLLVVCRPPSRRRRDSHWCATPPSVYWWCCAVLLRLLHPRRRMDGAADATPASPTSLLPIRHCELNLSPLCSWL
jgi:hypothetical protein